MELNLGTDISDVLKRDGVVLGSAGLVKSWLSKHAKTGVGKKIGNISAKKFAKGLGYVELANAASTTVQDLLPHVSEALDWSMALPFNILNQTLGRIPGIGAVFRWLHNLVTESVTKVADLVGLDGLAVTGSKLVLQDPNKGFETETNFSNPGHKYSKEEDEGMKNDPKFYGNLDLHKTFNIPGGYTKTSLINGTMSMPKIVSHELFENPNASRRSTIDRLNQTFTLIKAVRGLSAVQYNVTDLFNYLRFSKLMLLIYYNLKVVVKAAKTFSLVQIAVGDNIMESRGFSPTEVRTNLASYETLLTQYHKFISNNLPMTGDYIKRLAYLTQAFIPDYQDGKIATLHCFAVSMRHVYTSPDAAELSYDFRYGTTNDYNKLMTTFNNACSFIASQNTWQQMTADYFGAFGSKVIWEDKEYPEYKNPIKYSPMNDLGLEQIKNAIVGDARISVITITPGQANHRVVIDVDSPVAVANPTYTYPVDAYDDTTEVGLNYNNILLNDTYVKLERETPVGSSASAFKVLIPDLNGVGAQTIDLSDVESKLILKTNPNVIYSLHKENYSETEALEISQFKSQSLAFRVSTNNESGLDKVSVALIYKANEYFLTRSFAFVWGAFGGVGEKRINMINLAISDDDLQDTESGIDVPYQIQAWSLIDWMPMLHMTMFAFDSNAGSYYPNDIALLDMDGYGSLDDNAFKTEIDYSIYSLYACGIASGGKRVDNLNAAYKDRPSKQG